MSGREVRVIERLGRDYLTELGNAELMKALGRASLRRTNPRARTPRYAVMLDGERVGHVDGNPIGYGTMLRWRWQSVTGRLHSATSERTRAEAVLRLLEAAGYGD